MEITLRYPNATLEHILTDFARLEAKGYRLKEAKIVRFNATHYNADTRWIIREEMAES